ncbi:outer membrane protein assembly factor BamE [Azohydromonas caseinilytica]|uniref:Outer membrane protein assembly factor BamE n=1 Tax=Azohydromonas caseinilytica TaxID=2728836 RepID=A0A848FD37_9BURK|nr:outer membrane protein assembly factor BamE [Azohydromonas caseinilytica]NML16309.1 outer membrane protein assembly factor BamE [Azohydromonas caseinilytica]
MHRLVSRLPAALLAACSLAGCASLQSSDQNLLGLITPYRIEVVQGNVVTREQAAQVQPGMTRAQVRDILGSPLLTDIFHADRWDYVFTIRRSGAEPQRRGLTAFFDGERLQRLDASDDLPSEQEFVSSISTAKVPSKLPVLELTPEQRRALPAPAPTEPAVATTPAGPARAYPPLEP